MIQADEIGFECEMQENISCDGLRDTYKDGIIVWISGSGKTPDGKPAKYRCVLDYLGNVKYLEKELQEATANQAMIMGAVDAIRCVKKPFRIYLIAPTSLGFAAAFKGKGANVELVQELFQIVKEKEAALTEVQFLGGSDSIKKFIYSCNLDDLSRREDERKQEDKKNRYKEIIYKECLLKVERVLRARGVAEEIIQEVYKIKVQE